MPRRQHDSSPVSQRIGANIRRLRTEAGITRDHLAARSSVSENVIVFVERGETTPRVENLLKLAAGLAVSPSELLDGVAWKPTRPRHGEWEISRPRK